MARLRFLLMLGALAAVAVLAPPGRGVAQDPTGADIRAAFIYNFARFVDWPEDSLRDSGGNLRVCFRADDPLSEALQGIAGKGVGVRRIEVVPLAPSVPVPDNCQIMLLSRAEMSQNLPPAHGLLRVGEIGAIGETGVAIGLVQVGRQVRFQVDASRIDAAGLRISSKLMRLAVKVLP